MELALEAAETGHLVLSTLNTLDAQQTVGRFVGAFSAAEQPATRERLARMLRYVISQRLIPRKQDGGRVAVFEILKSGSSALEQLLETDAASSHAGREPGQSDIIGFDAEIERLVRAGIVSPEIALAHATDAGELEKKLAAPKK